MKSVTATAAGLTALVGLGAASPGPAFSSMVTKLGLASICGYQTVCCFGQWINVHAFIWENISNTLCIGYLCLS